MYHMLYKFRTSQTYRRWVFSLGRSWNGEAVLVQKMAPGVSWRWGMSMQSSMTSKRRTKWWHWSSWGTVFGGIEMGSFYDMFCNLLISFDIFWDFSIFFAVFILYFWHFLTVFESRWKSSWKMLILQRDTHFRSILECYRPFIASNWFASMPKLAQLQTCASSLSFVLPTICQQSSQDITSITNIIIFINSIMGEGSFSKWSRKSSSTQYSNFASLFTLPVQKC